MVKLVVVHLIRPMSVHIHSRGIKTHPQKTEKYFNQPLRHPYTSLLAFPNVNSGG